MVYFFLYGVLLIWYMVLPIQRSQRATPLVDFPRGPLKSCTEGVIAVLKKMTQRGAERLRVKKDLVANPGIITPSFQISTPSVTPACQQRLKHPQVVSSKRAVTTGCPNSVMAPDMHISVTGKNLVLFYF